MLLAHDRMQYQKLDLRPENSEQERRDPIINMKDGSALSSRKIERRRQQRTSSRTVRSFICASFASPGRSEEFGDVVGGETLSDEASFSLE